MLKKSKKIQAVLLIVLVLLTTTVSCAATQTEEMKTMSTGDAFLTELAEKTGSIEQYTDYKTDDYQSITLKSSSIAFDGTGATVDGDTITITEAGTYVISGTINDGQIIVDSEDDENVRLVLNNAGITSAGSAPILIKSAKNTIISLPAGTENVLTDGSGGTNDEEVTGALFSADDLWINGSGTLTINANYKDGISGNDDIEITQAKIIITAVDDGITANDSVSVSTADITIDAVGDGIKATNETETEKGYIAIKDGTFTITSGADSLQAETLLYIQGGNFSIDAGDDGLHANVSLAVTGGIINIEKSYEGIESKIIDLSGGTINIIASDDGINAAGDTEGSTLTISGGDIKVNAAGDGIDVNGSAYMTGGSVLVSGPTNNGNAALDYDGVFEVSGGTLLVAGSSGMAQAPSTSSTQYTIANTVGTQTAGTIAKLVDSSGKTIASFTPAKDYQHVVISSPDIKKGSTYTLYAGSTEIETFTISEAVSGDTASGGGMHGGPGGGGMPQGGGGGTPPDRNNQQ